MKKLQSSKDSKKRAAAAAALAYDDRDLSEDGEQSGVGFSWPKKWHEIWHENPLENRHQNRHVYTVK